MYLIIHETSISSLFKILKAGMLLKSSKIQELGLTTSQSNSGRRLAKDPKISLVDRNFSDKYDEVDGVYFRLLTINTPIKTNYGGDCVLIFSKNILEDHSFVINTEENFGFCIAEDGVVSEAQFSGEEGMSITNLNNLNFLSKYHFNPYSSEILILDNINLSDLKCIFIKSELLSKKVIDLIGGEDIQMYALD